MSWGRIDDGARQHAKMNLAKQRAEKTRRGRGDACVAMYRQAIDYCNENATDGFVMLDVLDTLTFDPRPVDVAEILVGAVVKPNGKGLFEPGNGGYWVHDFLDFNDSAATVAKRKADARIRMQSKRSGGVRANTPRTTTEPPANEERSSGEVPKVFLAGDPGPARPISHTQAGDPPEPDPKAAAAHSKLALAALDELRKLPPLEPIADADTANALAGVAGWTGKSEAQIRRAIQDTARKALGSALSRVALFELAKACVQYAHRIQPERAGGSRAAAYYGPQSSLGDPTDEEFARARGASNA